MFYIKIIIVSNRSNNYPYIWQTISMEKEKEIILLYGMIIVINFKEMAVRNRFCNIDTMPESRYSRLSY